MTADDMPNQRADWTGGEKTVLLAGQPLEIGDEACMMVTFADLHPRKQAEAALRPSEQRFATALMTARGGGGRKSFAAAPSSCGLTIAGDCPETP